MTPDDFTRPAPLSDGQSWAASDGEAWVIPKGEWRIADFTATSVGEASFVLVRAAREGVTVPTTAIGFAAFGGDAPTRTFYVTITTPDGVVGQERPMLARKTAVGWHFLDMLDVPPDSIVRVCTSPHPSR